MKKIWFVFECKKITFSMLEGKLIGYIASLEGIRIDPARVVGIQKINAPKNKKEVQSVMGK